MLNKIGGRGSPNGGAWDWRPAGFCTRTGDENLKYFKQVSPLLALARLFAGGAENRGFERAIKTWLRALYCTFELSTSWSPSLFLSLCQVLNKRISILTWKGVIKRECDCATRLAIGALSDGHWRGLLLTMKLRLVTVSARTALFMSVAEGPGIHHWQWRIVSLGWFFAVGAKFSSLKWLPFPNCDPCLPAGVQVSKPWSLPALLTGILLRRAHGHWQMRMRVGPRWRGNRRMWRAKSNHDTGLQVFKCSSVNHDTGLQVPAEEGRHGWDSRTNCDMGSFSVSSLMAIRKEISIMIGHGEWSL